MAAISQVMYEGSCFSTTLPTFFLILFFFFTMVWVWNSILWHFFICNSLMHCWSCIYIGYSYIFFGKISIEVICLLFWLSCFPSYCWVLLFRFGLFGIVCMQLFCQVCKIFSPSLFLVFVFLKVLFKEQQFWILVRLN